MCYFLFDFQLYKKFFETNSPHGPPGKDTATIMSIEGRAYPVDIHYTTQPVPSYLMGVVETVLALHREQGVGDILAFLTGQEEVERAVAEIKCVCVCVRCMLRVLIEDM